MNRYFFYTLSAVFVWLATLSCDSPKHRMPVQDSMAHPPASDTLQEQLPVIMFFGNSLTAGYMLDISEAFPALIQRRLDSLGYRYTVINAGLSGETTAAGVTRIDWVLRTIPDIFVLELGANDALRGLPLAETKNNLQRIIDKVLESNPDTKIIIAGMRVPPNLGQEYTAGFAGLFREVADDNEAVLIPFLLKGVAGDPDLNLPDGIHPTAEGHRILAGTVWTYLQPLLTLPPK